MNPQSLSNSAPVIKDLQTQLALGADLLALTQREHLALRAAGDFPAADFDHQRKALLPRLKLSLEGMGKCRRAWQELSPAERAGHADVIALVRSNQDLIMKILMLDRENEHLRLRRGLVPARHLPRAAGQHPHFVAELYRRHSGP